MMAWALSIVAVPWSIGWVAYFLGALLSAAMVTGATLTMIGATALIWTRSNHLYSLFFGFWELSRYPLNISGQELTERFVRGDASRSTEGSGLGLSIAQSLTQLQKGLFEIVIDGDLFKAHLTFPPAAEGSK